MTTLTHLIGRTLHVDGVVVEFSLWQRHQHRRCYINAPGCRRSDYIDLRTGELHCSPRALQLLHSALRRPTPPRTGSATPLGLRLRLQHPHSHGA